MKKDPKRNYEVYVFEDGEFRLFRRCGNEADLIRLIARYDDPGSNGIYENRFLDDYNMTGNDRDRKGGIRRYRVLDGTGHPVDVRRWEQKIRSETGRMYARYGDRCAYRHRNGPAPHTGGWSGTRYFRRVRCWANAYRQDRIPEYRRYVRKKGMVPNAWDTEPFRPYSRSWKDCTKKRRQWERK